MVSQELIDKYMDKLMDESLKADIERTRDLIAKVQESIYRMFNDDTDSTYQQIKMGTVMVFAIINRMAGGKSPKDFTPQDWVEISEEVMDKAILPDESQYCRLVFLTYADYIEVSAKTWNSVILSEGAYDKLEALAAEIRVLTASYDGGEISEADYIEKCLWISLEAMIKLLAAFLTRAAGSEMSALVQAVADFSLQMGRLTLYRQEQELLSMYLENQRVLDEELSRRYEEYVKELEARAQEFRTLVDRAYSDDFRERFLATADLAAASGADESEILYDLNEMDEYFM